MIEIRIHGRGGQGAVVASKVLASAFFQEGKFVQVFPEFGVERRGAPVTAYARVDEEVIDLRCKIYEPDHIIVLDETLIGAVNVVEGLRNKGWALINSDRTPEEMPDLGDYRLATVDATAIALKHRLGSRASPIVNTSIIGAFSRITGLVGIDSVATAIAEEVPVNRANNEKAAREAFELVKYEDGAGGRK